MRRKKPKGKYRRCFNCYAKTHRRKWKGFAKGVCPVCGSAAGYWISNHRESKKERERKAREKQRELQLRRSGIKHT